ncbi:MAG: hypothetical protein EU539_03650 [Promethearchaeota archaeon]|nr:MAG: hypothetical protein EU539_03650 [Candidatus Lokiarchaeota archaeon]
MPKIRKKKRKTSISKKISEKDETFILRSLKISAFLAGLFLCLSLLFNGEIITIFMNRDIYWDILDISIKVSLILLGFLFMIISISNYKELTGKPIGLKEILLLIGLSLAQTVRNLYVFIFTSVGLIMLVVYLYLIQES